jgi:ComF family protein
MCRVVPGSGQIAHHDGFSDPAGWVMAFDVLLGLLLCPICRNDWPGPAGCCRRCGALFAKGANRGLALPGLAALGYYRGELALAVRAYKFRGARRLARPFSVALAAAIAGRGWRVDWVTHVPLHPARRRSRGFDQAGLLAGAVARHLDVGSLQLLARTRDTRQQAWLGAAERRRNLSSAFRATAVPGGNVLLIDDVFTTGATLGACRRALEEAGAATVLYAVLAVAPRPTGPRFSEAWLER